MRERWIEIVAAWNKRPVQIRNPCICSAHFPPESIVHVPGRGASKHINTIVPTIKEDTNAQNKSLNNNNMEKNSFPTAIKRREPTKNINVADDDYILVEEFLDDAKIDVTGDIVIFNSV